MLSLGISHHCRSGFPKCGLCHRASSATAEVGHKVWGGEVGGWRVADEIEMEIETS